MFSSRDQSPPDDSSQRGSPPNQKSESPLNNFDLAGVLDGVFKIIFKFGSNRIFDGFGFG